MAVTVYRKTDRIKVRAGELIFTVAPLTYDQKEEINAVSREIVNGEYVVSGMKIYYKSVQFALKDIDGLVDVDGNKYELKFNERGITTECMDELFNMEFNEHMMDICRNMVAGIPTKIIDPSTGKELEGVEIIRGK